MEVFVVRKMAAATEVAGAADEVVDNLQAIDFEQDH